MEKSAETLYIPTNIATRFEFLPGLGMSEAIIGAVTGAVAALFSYIFLSFYSGVAVTVILAVGTTITFATVYKGNIIKNLIMDCQSYTKYRPNETTGGIFVSWRRKEELPTGV